MASLTCTITKAGRSDAYGRPLTQGQTYTSGFDEIKSLVQAGFASVDNPAITLNDGVENTDDGLSVIFGAGVTVDKNTGAAKGVIGLDGEEIELNKTGFALSKFNANTPFGRQFKWSETTITSNTGGTNTVVDFPGMSGVTGLRFQPSGAAAAVQGNFATALDFSLIETIYIPIIPRDIGVGRSLSLWFFLASDTGMVNRVQCRVHLRSLPPDQVHIVSISPKQAMSVVDGSITDGWSANGGTINWAAITTVRVACEASSAADADNYFYVGDIFTDAPRDTPAFMIGFDKNLNSQWDNAAAILRKYDIPATFYVEKFRIGQAGQFGLDKMKALSDMGHKIALHSFSQYLDTSNATAFPTAKSITAEILGFMDWARSNGLNYCKTHCCIAVGAPWDAPATYAAAKRAINGYIGGGIKTVRMSNDAYNTNRLPQTIQGFGGFALPTMPLVGTTSQVDVNSRIDKAATTQGLASFYTHEVTATASGNGTSIAVLDATLAKAAELRAKGLLKIITPD